MNSTLPILQRSDLERSCGDCQLCCEKIAIPFLNKAADTECVHQCSGGCAIYEDRPAPCATYRCSWLEGLLEPDELRPDRIDLLIETMYANIDGQRFNLLMCIGEPEAWERSKMSLGLQTGEHLAICFVSETVKEILAFDDKSSLTAMKFMQDLMSGKASMLTEDGLRLNARDGFTRAL